MRSASKETEEQDTGSEGPRPLVRIVLPVLVVVLGGAVALALFLTRDEAEMAGGEARVTPVETVRVSRGDRTVTVHTTGSVRPARRVGLEPQVSGRVDWVSPRLRPGGRFREGEVMARIDDRDYRVAVAQQEAAVLRGEVALQVEQGRKTVAEREWALLDSIPASDQGRKLALREPQLAEARATLEAARAALEQARLNVERTVIRAPFDLAVESENVDVGQVVRPGVPMAGVVGTRVFWIHVPVPVDELPWLEIPGSEATVTQNLARESTGRRAGRAVDLLPSVEQGGMMARVLVAVEDPLTGETGQGKVSVDRRPVPLLVGSVVQVSLQGVVADSVYAVPRAVLRRDDTAWLVSDSSTLQVVEVEVVHRGPDSLLLRGDLGESPRFVTSMIATPLEGMALALQASQERSGESPPAADTTGPDPTREQGGEGGS